MSGGFTSTRGSVTVPLETALFTAIASDGGLFVPESLPELEWPAATGGLGVDGLDPAVDMRPVARWAARAFFPSLEPSTVAGAVDDALDFAVPVVEVEPGLWVLELFHGPTHAFKDVGARFMAALMGAVGGGGGVGNDSRTILVATSGDTGGAVASAFHGRPGYRVVVLFPQDGISERQRRQMTTLGDNVVAVAVGGTFDDCQRLVKDAFRDPVLSAEHRLTSANSINIGRLLPQSFYYLHAAHRFGTAQREFEPWFVVPAGNLGNLCAGLMAWRSGMPAAGFTAATNENRGFADYLGGREFEARPSISTTSSAMDVGDPSNLERIRWLYGGHDERVREAVVGEVVDEADVFRCIADVHERTGYVLDPHAAVAYTAAMRQNASPQSPAVVLATAHPAKFPEIVEQAIGESVEIPVGLRAVQDLEESMTAIGPDLDSLVGLLEDSA